MNKKVQKIKVGIQFGGSKELFSVPAQPYTLETSEVNLDNPKSDTTLGSIKYEWLGKDIFVQSTSQYLPEDVDQIPELIFSIYECLFTGIKRIGYFRFKLSLNENFYEAPKWH